MQNDKKAFEILEARITRLENLLVDLATFKHCHYIYLSDLRKTIEKHGLLREVKLEPKKPYRKAIIKKRKKKQWKR